MLKPGAAQQRAALDATRAFSSAGAMLKKPTNDNLPAK